MIARGADEVLVLSNDQYDTGSKVLSQLYSSFYSLALFSLFFSI